MIQANDLPPSNPDAEKHLLGSMLRDNLLLPEVMMLLRGDEFYIYAHRLIYEAMVALSEVGHQVDIVTVAERMMREKTIVELGGGASYLAELWDRWSSSGNYRHYAEMIREASITRNVLYACDEVQQEARSRTLNAGELLDSAQRRIMDIAERGAVSETVPVATVVSEAYERMDQRKARSESGETNGVPTGFLDLDRLLTGFQNSELILLAARPSVGKTAMALQIARHAAVDCRMPILFVSLEQARVELGERLLCSLAGVDSNKLRKGHLNPEDTRRIMDAGDLLQQAPMFIDDSPVQSILKISSNARRLKKRHDLRLVVIDYLQLIEPDDHRKPRQEQVSSLSRRLKFLARELKIPVIALAQVNRSSEERVSRKPRLSDLRESGALEQDADTVLLMHREQDGDYGEIEMIVAKQRNGPTGEVKLIYTKQFMRFSNFYVTSSASA